MRTKIILGTIRKNKLRFLLCIVSMTFAVALLYSSLSIIGTLLLSYEKAEKIFYGNSDIKVSADKGNSDMYFNIDDLNFIHKEDIKYIIDSPIVQGTYTQDDSLEKLIFRGMTVEETSLSELFSGLHDSQPEEFIGDKIIVSSYFADKYSYNISDIVSINILGERHDFEIWGIFKGDGAFNEAAYKSMVVMPKDTVKSLLSCDSEKTNFALIKMKKKSEINRVINELNTDISGIKGETVFSTEDFYEKMQGIIIVFIITSVVIIVMCTVIVYQTFRVIMYDRMHTFGIVRCLGSSKGYFNVMALQEGLIYGILSGILGGVSGIILTKVIGYMLKPESLNSGVFQINVTVLIFMIVFPVLLCIFLSSISVKKYAKQNIKDLLLNTLKNKEKRFVLRKNYFSLILFVVSVGGIFVISDSISGIFIILLIVISFVSFIGLISEIVNGVLKLLKKMYNFIKKGNIYFTINYLEKSNFFLSSCKIIVISVAAIIMINSALSSVMNNFSNMTSSYYLCNYYADGCNNIEAVKKELESVNAVKSSYDYISISDVEIVGKDRSLYVVDGADEDYFEFFSFDVTQELKEILNSGRNLILSESLRKNLDVHVGDEIKLIIDDRECQYVIRGFFETSYNNGDYALVSKSALLTDLNISSGTSLYINTYREDEMVMKEIRKVIESYGGNITLTKTLVRNELDAYEKMISAIRLISWLPLLVSIIVLISNSILGFYDKKRIIAIYRSVGMDIKTARKMMLIEQIIGGLLCGIQGIFLGNILIFQLKGFLNHINNTMYVQYSYKLSIVMAVVVVLVYILPFASYSVWALKFNLTSVLKHE